MLSDFNKITICLRGLENYASNYVALFSLHWSLTWETLMKTPKSNKHNIACRTGQQRLK